VSARSPASACGTTPRAGGAQITVVGIGADGWRGLTPAAQEAILAADEVFGSKRQLSLLPAHVPPRRAWPSPLAGALEELLARRHGRVCVLASGDPMLHGIGATLAARAAGGALRVIPHVSAFSLACARLGWAAAEVELVSAVARPPEVVARALAPRRRVIVYCTGADGAARIARVLRQRGCAASRFVVLEQLGGENERIVETTAGEFADQTLDPLHVVAIQCVADPGRELHARVPGLPDEAYESDGALTKWTIRAVTLASLAPGPQELLWDVGAGSGSVAIEWLRAESTARAIALERHPERLERARRNALALGVPGLEILAGEAPEALAGLPAPDAVFVGGGVSTPGVLEACWQALRPGGRIVANAVTLQGEAALTAACERHGGRLVRLEVSHAEPLGRYTAWRAQRPVVHWVCHKGMGARP
jgi:precorrin-6Y C5,15-methyltransferase (decarboxylating)